MVPFGTIRNIQPDGLDTHGKCESHLRGQTTVRIIVSVLMHEKGILGSPSENTQAYRIFVCAMLAV